MISAHLLAGEVSEISVTKAVIQQWHNGAFQQPLSENIKDYQLNLRRKKISEVRSIYLYISIYHTHTYIFACMCVQVSVSKHENQTENWTYLIREDSGIYKRRQDNNCLSFTRKFKLESTTCFMVHFWKEESKSPISCFLYIYCHSDFIKNSKVLSTYF